MRAFIDPAIVLSMVMLTLIFVLSVQVFFIAYMSIVVGDPIIRWARWKPFTGLTQTHVCSFSKRGLACDLIKS